MHAPPLLPSATLVVAMLALASLLELAAPLVVALPGLRGRRTTNLCVTVVTVVFNWVLTATAALAAVGLSSGTAGLMTRLGVPYGVQIFVGFLVLDFSFGYVAHRAMHVSPILWRAHRIHHSDPFVDATTTLRNHPIEGLWRMVCVLVPVWMLGLPAEAMVLQRLLTIVNGTLEHANLRLWPPLDRMLSLVWVTPNMHKVHHSRERTETNSNYGNILSVYDRMLRTFTPTDRVATVTYGLDGVDPVRACSLRSLLAMPFRPAREPVVTARDLKGGVA